MTDLPGPHELHSVGDWGHIVTTLYGDPDLTRDAAAACARATRPSDLDALARHDNDYVVFAVATNPATPADTLTALARHRKPEVRIILAGRRAGIPAAVLDLLASDPNQEVRLTVAGRADLTDKQRIILALATDM